MRYIAEHWAALLLAWFLIGCGLAPLVGMLFRIGDDRAGDRQPDRLRCEVESVPVHAPGGNP